VKTQHGVRRSVLLHFAGGATTKLAPPATQFVLLLIVARQSSVAEVGKLALASAASFACGGIADIGFATTLSVPLAYFGTTKPPVRGTRRTRLASAVAGALLYVALWGAGLGGHDARFLIVAPLPIVLALSFGFSGVVNAAGALWWEGAVALVEAAVVLLVTLVLVQTSDAALTGALVGLLAGRALGLALRVLVIRRLPRDESPLVSVARIQAPFAASTVLTVAQGQIELLALGFVGSFALAGVYGPLLRTATGLLLVAEAVSWALYGGVGRTPERQQRLVRLWTGIGLGLGACFAIVFAVAAHPFLEFLLGRDVGDAWGAIALLALVIATRFGSFVLTVPLVRAGRQREQVPVVAAAALVLAVLGPIAAASGSLTGLAGSRLASEAVIALGYLMLVRRGRSARSLVPLPAPGDNPGPGGSRLRVLVLAPFAPSLRGTHGGARVAAQLLDRLGERVDVGLVCFGDAGEPKVDEGLERRLSVVVEIPRRDHGRGVHRRALRRVRSRAGLLLGRPMWTDDVADGRFRTTLRELGERWRPDLFVIFYPVMGYYLDELARFPVPRVLVEPDPASFAAAERARWEPVWGRLVHWLDERAWRGFERRVLSGVSTVVVFAEQDRRTLAEASGGTPLVTIPFGTDFVERPPSPASDEPAILFVGSFVHVPNRDAAVRLVRDVLPRVRARRPDARLFLVGDRPPRELAGVEGVEVTGAVPDVAPFYARSSVVVAPLRLGGGMRVKVVEALAAGKPLVASTLAVSGLAVADGEELVLADSDDELAAALVRLVDDPALRRRLGEAARAWAEAHLGWEAVVERHERLYRQLVDQARQAAEARERASS
jgi:glycosyltransferase involved in cell wall biosynthesis/O-antigen/teichoic acid export membrane protein